MTPAESSPEPHLQRRFGLLQATAARHPQYRLGKLVAALNRIHNLGHWLFIAQLCYVPVVAQSYYQTCRRPHHDPP